MLECIYCDEPHDCMCYVKKGLDDFETNPRLCDKCQDWNDLTHLLYCKQYEYITIDSSFFKIPSHIITILLRNRHFLLERIHCPVARLKKRQKPPIKAPTFHMLDSPSVGTCLMCTFLKDVLSSVTKGLEDVKVALWYPFLRGSKHSGLEEKCLLLVCVSYATQSDPTNIQYKTMDIEMVLYYEEWDYRLKDVSRWNRTLIQTDVIKEWLKGCKKDHRDDCNKVVGQEKLPPGFRVIDTVTWNIVECQEPIGNVALSYVWAEATLASGEVPQNPFQLLPSNIQDLEQEGSLREKKDELPAVITDAIQLCVDIGIRYLWVDRFCIIQGDSDPSQLVQINSMDVIYRRADLTIVALRGSLGLLGVSSRPRCLSPFEVATDDHENTEWELKYDLHLRMRPPKLETIVNLSKWKTRGWTYQELLLSRRHLFFSHNHVFFNCARNTYYENKYPAPIHMDVNEKRYVLELRDSKKRRGFINYSHALEDYLSRTLGNEKTDILRAFKGVENYLTSRYHPSFLHGLMEISFYPSLLWYEDGTKGIRDTTNQFPSWSWAAWKGASWEEQCVCGRKKLSMDPFDVRSFRNLGNLVTFYYVDKNTNVKQIKEERFWFNDRKSLSQMSNLEERKLAYVSNLKALDEWLEAFQTWDLCVQNPWEAEKYAELSAEDLVRVRNYPDGLVFNTTCASLRIQEPATDRPNKTSKVDDFVAFDIVDWKDRVVGKTRLMNRTAAKEIFLSEVVFLIAVLGAALSNSSEEDVEPWGLYVMIMADEDPTRRLGIGFVDPIDWTVLRPQWRTIILQ
ncbi:heterokaryon incompatibility protein-domain-containing protein [Annulohypoxylon stygium]|nr:heterokaryon incompatibility protein-domain-containing protein [Annulohypoxylon stygium]